ncbi:MAG: PKD domain-containing protein [Crocinitomix sp.]|nr:PKD domain-containing protein [Crocinitomix sp.]
MKKFNHKPLSLLTILFLCGIFQLHGQEFINGSFEDNTGVEGINMTNPAFNAAVPNCTGLEDFGAGGVPNLDLITTFGFGTYAPAYEGDWLVGLHKIDIVALELTSPLTSGNTYIISFWNKYAFGGITTNIELGASVGGLDFGTEIALTFEYIVGEWAYVEVEFVAPNDATHITVSLHEVGAETWVGVDDFKFVCIPLTVTAPVTEVCLGEEITLSATSESGAAISWSDGVINGEPFEPGLGTTTYTATSDSPDDCEATVEVIVHALPPVDAGPDLEICLGDLIILESDGPGVVAYVWDGGVADGVAFSPPATAIYTLTGTGPYGCVDTDEMEVTVNPLPIIDAGEDFTVCAGESVSLSGSGAGVGGTYEWDGGIIDGELFATLITTTYTVTGTDANGCVNTDDVTINVNPLPAVDGGPDQVICFGDETVLVASGAGPDGIYVWDLGIIDGEPFTPIETLTYTVTGTDENGCENADLVTITVSALPEINAGPDFEICVGDETVLNGTGAGVGGTYTWDDGVVNGVSFTPGATATYTVIGEDALGCIESDAVTITVNPLPIVLFTGDQLADCPPLFVMFNSLNPGESFAWEFGDGSIGGGSTVTHNYDITGVYDITLTVTSADGCINSATYYDYIEVYPVPSAAFTYFPDDVYVSDPHVRFNNHSTNATAYIWNFGDETSLSNEFEPEHTYPGVGDTQYTIDLIVSNEFGCADTAQRTILIKEDVLYFIPNSFTPDGDAFNQEFKPVFVSGLDIYDYHLMIFNRWGELLFESYDATHGWNGTYGGQLVDDGTYVWTLDFGETKSDQRHKINGHVNVLK